MVNLHSIGIIICIAEFFIKIHCQNSNNVRSIDPNTILYTLELTIITMYYS